MTRGMILYAMILLIVSINIGILIKMKSFGAKGKTFLYVPIVIPLVFQFSFKSGLKQLKKEEYSLDGYKKFFMILSISFKRLSLLCGIVCMTMVDIQREIQENKIKNRETCYVKFENNLRHQYREIFC